jgi:hypothetical protein
MSGLANDCKTKHWRPLSILIIFASKLLQSVAVAIEMLGLDIFVNPKVIDVYRDFLVRAIFVAVRRTVTQSGGIIGR